MPCDNLDHEHLPWPVGVQQLLVLEACERKCGWCIYVAKSANNLRVHARRYVANGKEPSLQGIKVMKGKAGRKNLQMDRRRTPAFRDHDRDLEKSPALDLPDSLPRHVGFSGVGDDMTSDVGPDLVRQQSIHESGISIPPSHPTQQLANLERTQERNAASTDVVTWAKPRGHQDPPLYSQSSDVMVISGQNISMSPSGPSLLDPNLFFLYDDFVPPLSISLWEARPINYPSTCKFDTVCLDLIQTFKPINAVGGNKFEFSNPSFPHITALLNPESNSLIYPLTAAIVSKIIYVFTMQSLPEQIAVMYLICSMIRWMITGSEEDYYLMPSWLRPGAAQIVTAHPVWVDMIPWPEARNRLCRNSQYHDSFEAFMKVYNETLSVNWHYRAEDTLIKISPSEFAINPGFLSHLRVNSNWTLGPSFLEKYPEFEGEVNIGKPRLWGATFM